jgi:plastocyanin
MFGSKAMPNQEGGTVRRALRSRTGIVAVVVGLAALGLSGPAGAEKAEPAQRADAVPADDITGQDHPADVFVQAWQYIPAEVHVKQGTSIKFGNYDMYPYGAGIAAHSMEEAIPGCTQPPYTKCDRYPLFTSALTDHGYVHKVEGVEKLQKGTYPFTCQIHSQMIGTLIVE